MVTCFDFHFQVAMTDIQLNYVLKDLTFLLFKLSTPNGGEKTKVVLFLNRNYVSLPLLKNLDFKNYK